MEKFDIHGTTPGFIYRLTFASRCFQANLLPLLYLPVSLSGIIFEQSRLIIPLPKPPGTAKHPALKQAPTDTVYLPAVDPILTAYANSYMAIQFTLRFVKYVQNPVNKSKGKTLTSDKAHQLETLAFYKADLANVASLERLLQTEKAKYLDQLKSIQYTYKDKTHTLTVEEAEKFILRVNESLEATQLKSFFSVSKSAVYERADFKEIEITPESVIDDPKVEALLDVLVFSEGTGAGYGTIVKGVVLAAPFNPDLVGKTNVSIDDYSKHPQILVSVTGTGLKSTAAGRYQFKYETWKYYGGAGLDFQPRTQDLMAVKAMISRGMIDLLLSGEIKKAINAGSGEWASLPMSNGKSQYSQPVKSMDELLRIYNQALAGYQKK